MQSHILRKLMMAMLTLLVSASSLIFSAKQSYADVRTNKGIQFEIVISDTITKKDADYVARLATELEYGNVVVILNSSVGDVDAAMQIGRIIRKNEASTQVVQNGKCYGSCALIYVAGVRRRNSGIIGLHRPYVASASQNHQELERHTLFILQQLKNYLQEMGMTDNFYQEMINTEPSNTILYRYEDIKALVSETDAKYDEIQTSYRARLRGVDTAEIRRREMDAKQCTNYVCSDAVLWGLSEDVYRKRDTKIKRCKLSEEQEHALKLLKRDERRDHPLWLKREFCIRNIMLGR
jgi:hypothetical protein